LKPLPQILAMGSRMSRGALRLVHTPSMTVFANWPTRQTPLQYVHSVAFSPGGGLLAVGTARGRALLYRLNHYAKA
jgi:U3 small nucleolar RNA-associated protein 18